MKAKGLTVIEVCVAITIIFIIVAMGVTYYKTFTGVDSDFDYTFINPQLETAIQQRKIADELKRQNDLMEERMNQQKAEYENRNSP